MNCDDFIGVMFNDRLLLVCWWWWWWCCCWCGGGAAGVVVVVVVVVVVAENEIVTISSVTLYIFYRILFVCCLNFHIVHYLLSVFTVLCL
jgi:hypothetical protein